MLKVSDAVAGLVRENPLFHFGFHHQLLNLSQMARFLRPLVEARTLKEVQETAIQMALSRMRKDFPPLESLPQSFKLDKINVHAGLCSCTWSKTDSAHRQLNLLHQMVQKDKGFMTLTEGMTEMTAILEEAHYEAALETIAESPRHVYRPIAAVGVKFQDRHLRTSGLIYQLVQQLALQRINLIEVTSTATEFSMYVAEADLQLAFDSLYNRFLVKR